MSSAQANRVDTDRLRQQHPIAELVERYGVELRRSGSSLTGRCPFHLDRGRPNLTVFPRTGTFCCFRCGARGDSISFIQQIENVTFRDAVTRLDATGTSRPTSPRMRAVRHRPRASGRTVADPECAAALTAAVDLYRNRLLHDASALAYLAARGFERDIVE